MIISTNWYEATVNQLKELERLKVTMLGSNVVAISYDTKTDNFIENKTDVLNDISSNIVYITRLISDYDRAEGEACKAGYTNSQLRFMTSIYQTFVVLSDIDSGINKKDRNDVTQEMIMLLSCEFNKPYGEIIKCIHKWTTWMTRYNNLNLCLWLKQFVSDNEIDMYHISRLDEVI